MERKEGPTSGGGDYSISRYLNDEGKEVPKEEATRVVIKEYKNNGELVKTVYGAKKNKEIDEEKSSEKA